MIDLVRRSQFGAHVRAVLLQGIAVGGFNVVDIHGLSEALGVPVLVVTRRPPDMEAVRQALFSDAPRARPRVPGAARKWALIERAGAIEPLGASRRATRRQARPTGLRGAKQRLWVQRAALRSRPRAASSPDTTLHGNVPEPLRLAHLIAGGIATGRSPAAPERYGAVCGAARFVGAARPRVAIPRRPAAVEDARFRGATPGHPCSDKRHHPAPFHADDERRTPSRDTSSPEDYTLGAPTPTTTRRW